MTTARRRNRQPKSQGEDTALAQDYRATLWRMADALRGSMDAAEYKHVVLGPNLPQVHFRRLRGSLRPVGSRARPGR